MDTSEEGGAGGSAAEAVVLIYGGFSGESVEGDAFYIDPSAHPFLPSPPLPSLPSFSSFSSLPHSSPPFSPPLPSLHSSTSFSPLLFHLFTPPFLPSPP